MPRRNDPSDDWLNEVTSWDDDFAGSSRARPIAAVLVVLLLVVAVGVGAWLLLRDRLFDSPEHAAREWTRAFIEGDTERLLDRTCNDQVWIANARAAAQTVPELLTVVPLFEILDLASVLPGVDLDLESMLDKINFDLSKLIYTVPNDAVGRTVLAVDGQLRINPIGDIWFGIPIEQRWITLEENGSWRWCGLESGQLPIPLP